MNGVIICGYPGVGKTTIAGKDNIIDLESSNFKFFGPPDCSHYWIEQYGRVALDLAKQGYIVLCSTHVEVIEWMHDHAPEMRRLAVSGPYIVCPAKELKYEWIKRLHDRFMRDQISKNYRAYERAKEHFDEDIDYLLSFAPSHVFKVGIFTDTLESRIEEILWKRERDKLL